ncbi:MAG: alpha/beta fold hydrolase [Solimonas sp.]
MDIIEELDWKGPVLVVPGLRGSGESHWQSRWERRNARLRRVEQADWNTPDLDVWARRIVETALDLDGPALVVAHSFGCLAAVRAQAFQSSLIAGALLVAPANPDKFGAAARLPRGPLLFPSTLIASRNDPWMPYDDAERWAARWGSRFISVGDCGHVNADSGLGDWEDGQMLLEDLCRRVNRTPRRLPPGPPPIVGPLRWAA